MGRLELPVAVQELTVSFSGPEAAAMRYLHQGQVAPPDLAMAVQVCIAKSLQRLLRNAVRQRYPKRVLFVGGVSANQFVRAWAAGAFVRLGALVCRPKIQHRQCRRHGTLWIGEVMWCRYSR